MVLHGKSSPPRFNIKEHKLVARGLGGCVGVNSTGTGDWDKIWTPSFLCSATNLTPRNIWQALLFRSTKEAETLLSRGRISFHQSGRGSKQAKGPQDLHIGSQSMAWARQAPKKSRGDPRPRDVIAWQRLGPRGSLELATWPQTHVWAAMWHLPSSLSLDCSSVSSLVKLLELSFYRRGAD